MVRYWLQQDVFREGSGEMSELSIMRMLNAVTKTYLSNILNAGQGRLEDSLIPRSIGEFHAIDINEIGVDCMKTIRRRERKRP